MTQSTQRALLLAFAGFAAALFTTFTTKLASVIGWFYPGLVFGIAIAAVLGLYSGTRSLLKLSGLIAASTVAYPISVWAAMVMLVFGKGHMGSGTAGRTDIPVPVSFIAGCIGAFIIYIAALVLLGPANSTGRSMAGPFYWSLIGGVLAVIGLVASGAVKSAPAQNNDDAVQDPVLSVIWQTGVALCAAFVVPVADGRKPAPRSTAMRVMVTLLGAAIFVSLAYFVLRLFRW